MDQERLKRKGFSLLLTFLVGVLLGVIATILAPSIVGPYMPDGLRNNKPIEGQVLTKGMDLDRLLLRITSEEGVMLATFTQKQNEIDLLIEQGDTVTLRVTRYQPFLEDPIIERVRKSVQPAQEEAIEEVSSYAEAEREQKPDLETVPRQEEQPPDEPSGEPPAGQDREILPPSR